LLICKKNKIINDKETLFRENNNLFFMKQEIQALETKPNWTSEEETLNQQSYWLSKIDLLALPERAFGISQVLQ
jgi:hypothetical protein